MLGGNEFRLRKSSAYGSGFTALIAPPHLRWGPEGDILHCCILPFYTWICSMRKASMMSPSLMSWNFSKVIPHS